MPGNDDWLSTGDAADALGLTPRTVYRLINTGELVAYRFGRVIRIKKTDVEDYTERHRIQPGDLEHLIGPDPSEDDDQE